MRYLAIITDPNTSVKDKFDAINSDIHQNIALLKLKYEGSLFVQNYRQKQERLARYRPNLRL